MDYMFSDMQKNTVNLGLIYVSLGILFSLLIEFRSFTALIPVIPGIIFIALGLLAKKTSIRKHVIHVAMAFAVLAAFTLINGIRRLVPLFSGEELQRPIATYEMLIMGLLAIGYLILGIKSFVAARKEKH